MRESLKKILTLCIAVMLVCGLVACNKSSQQEKSEQERANEKYIDIVFNDGTFIDVDNGSDERKIADYSTDEMEAEIKSYSYGDMDGDGLNELMVYLNIDNGTFKVFTYRDGDIYGYEWSYSAARSMSNTGTMIELGLGGVIEYYSLMFTDTGVERKILGGIKIDEEGQRIYYIDGENVEKSELDNYIKIIIDGYMDIYQDLNQLENVLSQ